MSSVRRNDDFDVASFALPSFIPSCVKCPAGNHEYYHGNQGDVEPWKAFYAKALNFTVLDNTAVTAKSLGCSCASGL